MSLQSTKYEQSIKVISLLVRSNKNKKGQCQVEPGNIAHKGNGMLKTVKGPRFGEMPSIAHI